MYQWHLDFVPEFIMTQLHLYPWIIVLCLVMFVICFKKEGADRQNDQFRTWMLIFFTTYQKVVWILKLKPNAHQQKLRPWLDLRFQILQVDCHLSAKLTLVKYWDVRKLYKLHLNITKNRHYFIKGVYNSISRTHQHLCGDQGKRENLN